MSATLISRSSDLARLEAEGLRLRVVQGSANHLLVEGIPSVNSRRQVVLGTLYSPLEIDATGKAANPPSNHQCWWIADESPCNAAGQEMREMISNPGVEDKGDGITTVVGFSRKRSDRTPYANYHEKIWTYVTLIWQESQAIDPACDPRSNKPVPAVIQAQEHAFHYPDMATTRAGIGAATAKLLQNRVAIIGLGGSGSYILDLLAKTPVREIHPFDGDDFELHNAFRAPGAPGLADLEQKPKKVHWFAEIYGHMHKGIVPHAYQIGEIQLDELAGFDFAFIAIDSPPARKIIHQGLIARNVPFIDTGLDLALDKTSSLRGQVRVTTATREFYGHLEQAVSYADGPENNVYRNIQVADMNMLSAAYAVMKWKKLLGFYADDVREHHSLYNVASNSLVKGDRA
jgi:hypothetical protein